MTATNSKSSLAPLWLLVLMAIPVLAGGLRLFWLGTGAEITPENSRFFAQPIPVVVHIIGAVVYSLLGITQFIGAIRRRFPAWHRGAGRVLVVAGLAAALSGLWMTVFYPMEHVQGPVLYGFRLVFGGAMTIWLVQAYIAARRRNFNLHRACMIRAYAVGVAAGTQAVIMGPYMLAFGRPDQLTNDLLMGFCWLLNLAIAEWIIRGRRLGSRPEAQLASR